MKISEASSPACTPGSQGSLHAVVDSGTDIDMKATRLAEQVFVLRQTAAVTVKSGIGRGFTVDAPKQAAFVLAVHNMHQSS